MSSQREACLAGGESIKNSRPRGLVHLLKAYLACLRFSCLLVACDHLVACGQLLNQCIHSIEFVGFTQFMQCTLFIQFIEFTDFTQFMQCTQFIQCIQLFQFIRVSHSTQSIHSLQLIHLIHSIHSGHPTHDLLTV